MHTPEEAKNLWCPMVRAARRERERPENPRSSLGQGETYIVGGCNTDALGGDRVPASCRCIANKCAMWRWEVDYPDGVLKRKETGYCGLAGLTV